jgi:hypothetical protein
MEPKVQLALNGQGVNQEDFNAIGRQAAMNAEYIWAQLLRLAPPGSGSGFTPARGIIPSGGQAHPAGTYSEFHRKGLLGPSGANDAKIVVQPFVAVVGSTTNEATTPADAHDLTTDGPRDAMREIRLAPHYGQVGKLFQTEIQIPAPAGNNRWDVIYAKVDIDQPDTAEARYVKTGDTAVTSENVSVTARTKVTIERAGGTEATNPVKPAIPSDGGGTYYILLGYYFVAAAHTLTTAIQPSRIHEAFTPILLSPANGGASCRPANGAFHPSGYAWAVEQWSNADGKPYTHMSPAACGEDKVTVAISADDALGRVSAPPNATTVLDDSIDWRKRYLVTVLEAANAAGQAYPHASGGGAAVLFMGIPSVTHIKGGQTFVDNASAASAAAINGGVVVYLDDATTPALATGAKLIIFARQSDGKLCVWRNNVDAGRRILAILSALGRFANSDAAGL